MHSENILLHQQYFHPSPDSNSSPSTSKLNCHTLSKQSLARLVRTDWCQLCSSMKSSQANPFTDQNPNANNSKWPQWPLLQQIWILFLLNLISTKHYNQDYHWPLKYNCNPNGYITCTVRRNHTGNVGTA